VGDAVATTTPTFGRGVATTFLQVRQLLALLDTGPDPALVAESFDAWCEDHMLPWVLDHTHLDGDLVRRWKGGDIDLTRRMPSDLILTAATMAPRIGEQITGYLAMFEPPSSLDPVEPLARAVYESGWRPAYSSGPTRSELVDIAAAVREDSAHTVT